MSEVRIPLSSAFGKWLCYAGLLTGQFLAILDVQIVASSLTQIQAGVSASTEEISWVQTCYLMSETLGISLVSALTKRIGQCEVFLASCSAFILTSLLVGFSSDLATLVGTRTLQGFFGGLMLPIAFTYGFTMFPTQLKGRISLSLSLVSVLAPTVGPTLGGYMSEQLSWSWLFFINLPLGLIASAFVWRFGTRRLGMVEPTPPTDWISFVLLAIFLLGIQYVLEEGQRAEWFASDDIILLTSASLLSLVLFVSRSLTTSSPLLDLRPFERREFSAGSLMIVVGGASLFGGSYLLPLFLADVRGYSPMQIGETLAVSGMVMIATGLFIGPRLEKIDLRFSMVVGFAISAYGFWLGREANSNWDYWEFASMQALRGFGALIAVTATQTLTMSSVDPARASSATSLLFLARNVGGGVGVALLSSNLARATQQAYSDFMSTARIEMYPLAPSGTGASISAVIWKNALVLAFNQCFAALAAASACAAIIALAISIKRPLR